MIKLTTRWGLFALLTGFITGCVSQTTKPPLYTQMTDQDVVLADASLQHSLERTVSANRTDWYNPKSGNGGSITPTKTFKHKDGYYCRYYNELIRISDQLQSYEEVACRSTDGTWYPL